MAAGGLYASLGVATVLRPRLRCEPLHDGHTQAGPSMLFVQIARRGAQRAGGLEKWLW